MVVAVSDKGIQNLAQQINVIYGKKIVTVERNSNGWFILIDKELVRVIERTCEVVHYLEGLKHGIELMKEGL